MQVFVTAADGIDNIWTYIFCKVVEKHS